MESICDNFVWVSLENIFLFSLRGAIAIKKGFYKWMLHPQCKKLYPFVGIIKFLSPLFHFLRFQLEDCKLKKILFSVEMVLQYPSSNTQVNLLIHLNGEAINIFFQLNERLFFLCIRSTFWKFQLDFINLLSITVSHGFQWSRSPNYVFFYFFYVKDYCIFGVLF